MRLIGSAALESSDNLSCVVKSAREALILAGLLALVGAAGSVGSVISSCSSMRRLSSYEMTVSARLRIS